MSINKYFDWAATTPPDADILENALEISQKNWGNPSSIYAHGKAAKDVLENARTRSAAALGCKPEQIFFTSGGTESDHIPMLSILNRPYAKTQDFRGTVLISALEHPAVREMGASLKNCGWRVVTIPSDGCGIITKDAVMNALTDDTVLVCVMAVNNETGAIQPVYEIADALSARTKETGKRRALLHVDCVQAIGKIPFDLTHTGIDSAAISAHKICGPRGIGALYLADSGKNFHAFTKGGGQERGIRSGTENVFGAVALSLCLERYAIPFDASARANRSACGTASAVASHSANANRSACGATSAASCEKNSPNEFCAACEVTAPCESTPLARYEQQKKYTAQFIDELRKISGCTIVPEYRANFATYTTAAPSEQNSSGKQNAPSEIATPSKSTTFCEQNSPSELYSPWIVQAAFKNIPGQVMVRALDADGFCISTGSACSATKQSRPILEAMHVPPAIRENAVRFSFGAHTTESDMNALVEEVHKVAEKFKGK